MDLDVDRATARPLDHLHLAIVYEHADHRGVDVKLIHVVHAARRRGVESFTEKEKPPGGTKRFGALSTLCGEESNAPGRERNYRSGQIATVFGELVDL
jgi:hypothetical protein